MAKRNWQGQNVQDSSDFWFPIWFYPLLQAVGSGKMDTTDSESQLSEELQKKQGLSVNNPLCFRPQCEALEVGEQEEATSGILA